ncbi:hypothetical protein AF335_00305 [Streptomyces eurocidicus]|uniref:Excreted virulence factor EspC (Type VII ESX diderm) n=1 Tax=Streptomyces eurocidicus TaxID=66423 RepID=A0A2N8P1J9_STREU|nr:hypothetical protein [Streptomyces eurocidicus]MBB5118441.1 hypothetical protein [Streptomyces eurocidicus]MBF6051893.1 hypothetical protein [Streptomyces eurocidicus]PNE34900.1 hypothetical protein AF335_00305 [Streptomyces eurocidicus]
MTLRVQPGELERFAGQLRRAADDAYDMLAHAERHTKIELLEEGAFGFVVGHHEELRETVLGALGHLADVLKGSAGGIEESVAYYRRTDLSLAARMDAAGSHAGTVREAAAYDTVAGRGAGPV